MKKASLLLALLLLLLPSVALAQGPAVQINNAAVVNAANVGSQTATNLNPNFYGVNFGGPANPPQTQPFYSAIQTDTYFLGAVVNPSVNKTGYATIPIYGMSVSCIPYNPLLAAAPPGEYPYQTETAGVGGGTVTLSEYTSTGPYAGTPIGTLTLPDSPHGGPYIGYASTTFPAPYIPTPHSSIVMGFGPGTPGLQQYYAQCDLVITLQNPNASGL